jgi:paraquat-inducible protein B
MSKHASPTVIGAFVVGALALLLAGILILGGGRYFHHTAHVIVYFDGSVDGLRIGAPVKFRGIEVGTVKDLRINMTGAIRDPLRVRIPALLEIDETRLTSQGLPRIDLNDRKKVDALVELGLRAQLQLESFVTGVRFVSLDIRPETPVVLTHDPKYPEVPSLRGAEAEIADKASHMFSKLAEIDFNRLVASLQSTVDHADQLVSSPEVADAVAHLDDITKNLAVTTRNLSHDSRELEPALAALKNTLARADQLVAPTGQLSNQLDATLRDIQSAARSLRRLADQLGRDPGAILRGGKQ